MAEKHFKITCKHSKEVCDNNKSGKCYLHCERSWETETIVQANMIKQMHIANEIIHKPIVKSIQ